MGAGDPDTIIEQRDAGRLPIRRRLKVRIDEVIAANPDQLASIPRWQRTSYSGFLSGR